MERKFELFEVLPNIDKLRSVRECYIDSLNGQVCFKAVSNNSKWFYYNDGIFDVRKLLGSKFFDFTLIPICSPKFQSTINMFKKYGITYSNDIKSIRFNNEEYFICVNQNSMCKQGRRYIAEPVIPLSEDIYNLSLIALGDFSRLEIQDLSKYSEFFTVRNKPNFIIYESRLEDAYRSGRFTLQEYKKMYEKFEKEERLVRTLRRK